MHERMNPIKKRLLNGLVTSHDDYLSLTGFWKGVHDIIDAPGRVAELVANEQGRRAERK